MRKEIKDLKKQLESGGGAKGATATADDLLAKAESIGGAKVIVADAGAATAEQLRQLVDSIKDKAGSVAVLLASAGGEKVSLAAGVSDDLIGKGLKAGDWVRQAANACGGGGGGRPNFAVAGGKEVAKLGDALDAARSYATGKIG